MTSVWIKMVCDGRCSALRCLVLFHVSCRDLCPVLYNIPTSVLSYVLPGELSTLCNRSFVLMSCSLRCAIAHPVPCAAVSGHTTGFPPLSASVICRTHTCQLCHTPLSHSRVVLPSISMMPSHSRPTSRALKGRTRTATLTEDMTATAAHLAAVKGNMLHRY